MRRNAAKAAEALALEPKNQTAFTKAVKNIKKGIDAKKEDEVKYRRGVIMVSHLPHGFFEDELKGFFSQFGKVLRVRVGRSLKTGRFRGYGFVEFEFEEVAQIAAESMNNYLMFERLIKCKVVDNSPKNTRNMFAFSNIRDDNYPTLNRRNQLKEQQSAPLTEEEVEKQAESRQKIIARHNNKLADRGLVYQFEDDEPEVPEKFVRKSAPYKPTKKAGVLSKTIAKTPVKKQSKSVKQKKTPKPKSPVIEEPPAPIIEEEEEEEAPAVAPKPRKSMKEEKFSPKMLRSRGRQSDVSDLKSLSSAKQSPKSAKKQARKSVGAKVVEQTPVAVEKHLKSIKQEKTPKTPKSETPATSPVVAAKPRKSIKEEKIPKTPKAETPVPVVAAAKPRKSIKEEKTPKTETPAPVAAAAKPRKSMKEEKFSPKMLRSRARQSDVSDLSSAKRQPTPKKASNNRRKTLK